MKLVNRIGGIFWFILYGVLGFSSILKFDVPFSWVIAISIEFFLFYAVYNAVVAAKKGNKPDMIVNICFWFANVTNGIAIALVPEKPNVISIVTGLVFVVFAWSAKHLLISGFVGGDEK